MNARSKVFIGSGFILLSLLLFLTLNKHSRSGLYNYHSEIFGDKAGYYVYLPAAFDYSFKGNNMPSKIDSLTGNGFQISPPEGKIITKYPYGVALMQLPFYLVAKIITQCTPEKDTGFNLNYHKLIDIAAVTYFTLGLLLLFKVLKTTFENSSLLIGLSSLFLGTNIFYYVIVETGMSHVYSFFLFTCLLALIKKISFNDQIKFKWVIGLGVISGLIIITRPSNIIALTGVFFLFTTTKEELITRVKWFFNPRVIIPICSIIAILIIPQLLYWKYAYGSLILDTYQNEQFNWLSPNVLHVLISPKNGLFLYGTIYLIVILAIIRNIENNYLYAYYLFLFFLILYISSSWWSWSFGCAYGGRNFIEYLVFFSIPYTSWVETFLNKKNYSSILFFSTILIFVVLNLKLVYTFDQCFFGKGDWDWNEYLKLITSSTI